MKAELAIGVDIGGGSIKSGIYSTSGEELEHITIQIPSLLTNDTFLTSVSSSVFPLLEKYKPIGIGIGSPGPLDTEKGILIGSANMPALTNVPLVYAVYNKFKIPVYYENDANCAALGEAYFGKHKDLSSLLILTLGTGIGGGFVDQKKLYTGFQGNGIEIGHMTSVIDGALCGCGQKGCVEAYFSTIGFLNRYQEIKHESLKNAHHFFDMIRSGENVANEILNFGVLALAETVRSAINLLNPEGVVFVGGITKAWDLYGEKLEHLIRLKILPVLNDRLKIGVGQNFAGSLGAAGLVFAKEKIYG